jgi:hypothetical protein
LTGGPGRGLIEDRAQSGSCESRGREGAPPANVEGGEVPDRPPVEDRVEDQDRRAGALGEALAGAGAPGGARSRRDQARALTGSPPAEIRRAIPPAEMTGRAGRCPEHGARIRSGSGGAL